MSALSPEVLEACDQLEHATRTRPPSPWWTIAADARREPDRVAGFLESFDLSRDEVEAALATFDRAVGLFEGLNGDLIGELFEELQREVAAAGITGPAGEVEVLARQADVLRTALALVRARRGDS